jgi:hypothetical protein
VSMIKLTLAPRGSGRTAVLLGDQELAIGTGAVVCQAARKLIERGHDPGVRLEAWRGDTLCLSGRLSTFARLTVQEGTADGVTRFVRWTAPPSDTSRNVQHRSQVSSEEVPLLPELPGSEALHEADQDA